MRRVLVLGATGTIGRPLVDMLVCEPGLEVRAATRSSATMARLRTLGADPVLFDFDVRDTYRKALEGVDVAFLLTGYSVDMLRHSKVFVDTAKRAGVGHIVHLGANAPDDTAFTHLAWHQLVERYIEWSGILFTHLRPAMFMVNIPRYMAAAQTTDVISHYIGDRRVAWVDTDDIAAAAAVVLRDPAAHAGRTYVLSSEARSMGEVADILSRELERPIRYEQREADEGLVRLLVAAGREPTYARSGVSFFAAVARGEAPGVDRVDDSLQRLIGREPRSWPDFARVNSHLFTPRSHAEAPDPSTTRSRA